MNKLANEMHRQASALEDAAAKLRAAAEDHDKDLADARRYRWLRSRDNYNQKGLGGGGGPKVFESRGDAMYFLTEDQLDAVIDEAMHEAQASALPTCGYDDCCIPG